MTKPKFIKIAVAVFFSTLILLFYFMPGMPPRKGEWYGNVEVDLHSGEVVNSIELGIMRNGRYKHSWHLARIGEVDIAHPLPWFTPEAKIGDQISGFVTIVDSEGVEYWRDPFQVLVVSFDGPKGGFAVSGGHYFGKDIKIDEKIARSKKLTAIIEIEEIDHDSFTDGLALKVSLLGTVRCRHIECLLD